MEMIYKVIDNGCEDVVNAWYPAFCIGIRSMDWNSFVDKLLPKILKLAGLQSTYVSRTAAANIVTAAAIIAAEKKALEKLLLHPYMELCQDSDVILRKTALTNLKLIFQKVEPSEVERLFFKDILDHLTDPSPAIRYIVFDVVLTFHKLFSTQCLLTEVVPLLIKEFEFTWKDPENWLVQNCGAAVSFMLERGLLQEDNVSIITKFYDPAINSEDVLVKQVAIRNLAPIIDMCFTKDADSVKYSKILNELSIGPLYQDCILQSLPDIVRVHYAHKKISLLRPTLTALMQNEDQSFAVDLIRAFSKMMPKVLSDDEYSDGKEGTAVIDEKYKEQVLDWIKGKWKIANSGSRRDLCSFIELLPACQEYFPIKDYSTYFMNEMVGIVKSGSRLEIKLASTSFCQLYLKNYVSEARKTALDKILVLARSLTCFERQAVLCFVEVAMNYFSRKFLAQSGIIKAYLSLAEDRVANVRIKFASIAGKIHKFITHEEAKPQLDSALTLLQNDMDKDVRKFAKDSYDAFKQGLSLISLKGSEEDGDSSKEKREQDLFKREKNVRV